MTTKWVIWLFIGVGLAVLPLYCLKEEVIKVVDEPPKGYLIYEDPGKHTVQSEFTETKGLQTKHEKKNLKKLKFSGRPANSPQSLYCCQFRFKFQFC